MKKLFPILLLVALASCQDIHPDSKNIQNIQAVMNLMENPPSEYRTAPLWDWNEKINREDIVFQLKQFKAGGLGGVFIHPRPGLVTEYLSDDWNSLFAFTVKTGKELGMNVWIYDENSYPSGFAGGHVQERFPDSYQQGTGLGLLKTKNLEDTIGLRVESILQKDPDSSYQVFYRTYPKESWWYGGYPYVDLLLPGVTDTFIRATMEGYEKSFGEEFGKSVPGVFTDEPNLPAAKGPGTALRWTPDLFDRFQDRWGYSLRENLISLTEEYGDWKKVRHNYHELLLELFLDRWAIPWNAYCESNNLIWTGHYWEHGWPYPGEGYDEAAFYMYHQMPGIDMLGRELCLDGMCQQFGNIRAVRELASAANQAGATRRFSETYGGAGWQINFTELKRLVDWECVLGVNFVNQHLSYFSMQGVRKFDYPPTFSYQEPWWESHAILGDYTARICLALSSGDQINPVLVLQPNTTAWMYHADANPHKEVNRLSVRFKEFINLLEANQLEYDLGSEQVLKRFGENQANGLQINQRIYSKIVLPPGMRNLDATSLKIMEDQLSKGLDILLLSDSIDHLDGAESKAFKTLETQYPSQIKRLNAEQEEAIADWFNQQDIRIKTLEGPSNAVFHQRRQLQDAELLFLVNSSPDSPARVELNWKGRNLAEVDLLTGRIIPIDFQAQNKEISAQLILNSAGSRLLINSKKPLTKKAPIENRKEFQIPQSGPVKVTRNGANVLTIDYLDLQTQDFKVSDRYFMNAMYKLFDWSGLPTGNPWQHKIQFRQKYLEMDRFDSSTWHQIEYHFEIGSDLTSKQIEGLRMVVERPEIWAIEVNNIPLKALPGEWWLDRHFPVYAIGKLAHTGTNTIRLKAEKMSVFAEIMPVYILGDFSVYSQETGFRIQQPESLKLGSWKDQGLPFYGHQISYQQDFELDAAPAKADHWVVRIQNWRGIVGEIWVNNQQAGTLAWQSEIEVGDLLQAGKNEIRFVLTGSLKNTLGFHHKDLVGWIDGPFSWNQAPENQPAGSEYQFMEYGLYGGIELIRKND